MTKALVIVDMLNDFIRPDGVIPVPETEKIIENINALREIYRRGDLVVYTNDAHSADDPEIKKWGAHCIKGTYGAQAIEELKPSKGDITLEKQAHSIFSNEKARRFLRDCELDELVVTGVAAEYCVKRTVLDALNEGYKVSIVVDGISGLSQDSYRTALGEMIAAGARPVSSKQILEGMLN